MGFLKKLFGRNKPPSAPDIQRQEAAPELMDFIDKITGVETVTVTDSQTGKKRRVTQRLPPTPQEQEILDRAQGLISKAVSNIETLYKYDPNSVVDYQPFIRAFSEINTERMNALNKIGNFEDIANKVKQFQAMNNEIFNRDFDNRERLTEEQLAKQGLSRSTLAAEQRALNARERSLGAQQADVTAYNYGEDLASRQLQRESTLFALQEADRGARLQEAETGYNLERRKSQELESLKDKAIAENMNLLGVGQGIQAEDRQKSQLGLSGGQAALNTFSAQANNQNTRYQINKQDAMAAKLLLWLVEQMPDDATVGEMDDVLDAAKFWSKIG